MLVRSSELPEERDERYQEMFNSLDVDGSGKITFEQMKKAMKVNKHPLSSNDYALRKLFECIDMNNDSIVDLEDFKKYAMKAESQIEKGFKKIDVDKDGKIRPSEISHYLSNLSSEKANGENVEKKRLNAAEPVKHASSITDFVTWAFNKKSHSSEVPIVESRKTENLDERHKDEFITYDQWRDFLFLMPKTEGSRLQTAYHYLFKEDVDLSSEGDVTLINDFIKGFGFFFAGGISGVVSRTCTAPLDRLKVFLIARTDLSSTLLTSKEVLHLKKPEVEIEKFRSPLIKAIKSLYRQGGFKAFYVGNGLNAIKVFPESSMKFGSFEITKKIMAKVEGCNSVENLSKVSTYVAGGLAGVVAQFSIYPIDTLKFRLQCAPLKTTLKGNELLIETAKQLYREGGLKMFYRGITVGVMGVFPYAALDLGTFTALKKWYTFTQSEKHNIPVDDVVIGNLVLLPMGAFSGTVGATAVYPINLLRTRLQAQGTFAHPYKYNGFTDVLKKTIQREGYPGLYKGLLPTLAKVCPAVSISYLCYENLKSLMDLQSV